MDEEKLLEKITEFITNSYLKDISVIAMSDDKFSLNVDFQVLDEYDSEIADLLLESPLQTILLFDRAIEEIELPVELKKIHARFSNLPDRSTIPIRKIRSKHIGKFISIRAIVRAATDVRPTVMFTTFECPTCGTLIEIIQDESKLKQPLQCSCGRKGRFKIHDKKLVDTQKVIVEEMPEMLEGAEQPKRISIFLVDDLVDPKMEKAVTPGSKVIINGILKEVPLTVGGAQLTKFDIIIDGNYVEQIESEFEDIELTKEDEAQIREFSKSPNLVGDLLDSIAPTIYGHNEIKEAILLQLFGGIRKERLDGTVTRGDTHILLVGDPGTAKCVSGDTKVLLKDGTYQKISEMVEDVLGKNKTDIDDGHYGTDNHSVLSMGLNGKVETKIANIFWKREAPKYMYKIKTQTGKEINVTPTHPFFICDGVISSKKAEEIKVGEEIATPRFLDIEPNDVIDVGIQRSKSKNPSHIKIPKKLTPPLSRILGYVIGDGYVQKTSSTYCVWFTNNNERLIKDFKKSVESIFGLTGSVRKPHKGKTAKDVYFPSVELGRFLEGIDGNISKKSRFKEVPKVVISSSKENVIAFLKSLFDCEGSFDKKRGISIPSASEELLKGVQLLLLRLGVISQIGYTITGPGTWKKKYYRLKISDRASLSVFAKEVGFKSKEIRSLDRKVNTNLDVIPGLSTLLKTIRLEMELSQSQMGISRSTYLHYERGDRRPSRQKLLDMCDHLSKIKKSKNLQIIKLLANSDIFWDKIVSKEKFKPKDKWVYDLQVQDTHNFVANGVFVHNSQLLSYVAKMAPKARYVSGKGTSSAGLTASVSKDDSPGGGWILEAGALPLTNKGILMIDEIDKMDQQDVVAMHQGLEQQQISISKANIHATLKCETSVLAAANPKFGRFNPYDSFYKQIDLPSPLLNRFDLLFTIKDVPSKYLDEKLANHILDIHSDSTSNPPKLEKRFLRKYIAYSKRVVKPVITKEAKKKIVDFYVELRSKAIAPGEEIQRVPLSPRQLEALVRLSEASARMKLKDKVEEEDADRAINLLQFSLRQVAVDEKGEIDVDRISGMGASRRGKLYKIRTSIREMSKDYDNGEIPTEDILEKAKSEKIKEEDAREIIFTLVKEGEVYQPKTGYIKLSPD